MNPNNRDTPVRKKRRRLYNNLEAQERQRVEIRATWLATTPITELQTLENHPRRAEEKEERVGKKVGEEYKNLEDQERQAPRRNSCRLARRRHPNYESEG